MANALLYSALKIGLDDRFVPLNHLRTDDQAPEFNNELNLNLLADRAFPAFCAHAQRIGADARKRALTAIEPRVTHESSNSGGVVSHRLAVIMGTVQEGFLQWSVPMGSFVPGRDTADEGAEISQICDNAAAQLTLALVQCHQSDAVLTIGAGLRSGPA